MVKKRIVPIITHARTHDNVIAVRYRAAVCNLSEENPSEITVRLFSPMLIRPEPMWWVAGGQGRENQEQNRQRRAFPMGSSLSLALSSSSSSILRTYKYSSSSQCFQVGASSEPARNQYECSS